MRAAELGLHVLGRRVKAQPTINAKTIRIEDADWQKILQHIDKKLNEAPPSTQSARRKKHLAFYSEIRANFAALKDAWRNNVAHPRKDFSVARATEIYGNVRQLMRLFSEGRP